MKYKQYSSAAALLALLAFSRPALSAQGAYSLSSGLDYSSGKYGGPTATEVTYIPVTGKYETESWILKLTVPYISITGPGNVIPNIGQVVNTSNAVRTDAGLGDILASTSYSLVNSKRSGVVIDVTGKVKFGTADKFRGLGSGANDYAGETSVYKIMDSLSVFGTLGYKVFGQSAGYTLNDVLYGSLGVSKKVGAQTSTGLIYDYREATTTWGDPQQIWTVFLNRKIDSKWKVQTYIFTGSGKSSPDYGAGAMLTDKF
ncbi:MAG: hypothetical protein FD173_715 [Gallionellaceae bacterium]|nr:MAG: hypothetical protein FD173_715 [Gallionellaceae bacterium]